MKTEIEKIEQFLNKKLDQMRENYSYMVDNYKFIYDQDPQNPKLGDLTDRLNLIVRELNDINVRIKEANRNMLEQKLELTEEENMELEEAERSDQIVNHFLPYVLCTQIASLEIQDSPCSDSYSKQVDTIFDE